MSDCLTLPHLSSFLCKGRYRWKQLHGSVVNVAQKDLQSVLRLWMAEFPWLGLKSLTVQHTVSLHGLNFISAKPIIQSIVNGLFQCLKTDPFTVNVLHSWICHKTYHNWHRSAKKPSGIKSILAFTTDASWPKKFSHWKHQWATRGSIYRFQNSPLCWALNGTILQINGVKTAFLDQPI